MAEKSVSTRGLWRFLNNLKDLFVQDAPSDGKQYARKNKTWAEVQGGGGPVDAYTKTESDSRFAHKTGNEDISGLKNFLNGIKSGTVNIPTASDGVTIAASDVDGDNGKVSIIGDAGSFTLEVERDPVSKNEVATKGYADTKLGQLEARKQDTISDLATIRSGAVKGATALQSVPSTYRTAAQQDAMHDDTKADVSALSALDTRVQALESDYATALTLL